MFQSLKQGNIGPKGDRGETGIPVSLIPGKVYKFHTVSKSFLRASFFLLGGGVKSDLGPEGDDRPEILRECQDACKGYCYIRIFCCCRKPFIYYVIVIYAN